MSTLVTWVLGLTPGQQDLLVSPVDDGLSPALGAALAPGALVHAMFCVTNGARLATCISVAQPILYDPSPPREGCIHPVAGPANSAPAAAFVASEPLAFTLSGLDDPESGVVALYARAGAPRGPPTSRARSS